MSEPVPYRSRANRLAAAGLGFFSSLALLTVATGYFQKPLPDEGAAAHIFQLSMVAFAAALLVFLATADWKNRRAFRTLGISAVTLGVALAALYYLENIFYATHFH